MKIEWPDLTFPPINLLNAPRALIVDHPIFGDVKISPPPVISALKRDLPELETIKSSR